MKTIKAMMVVVALIALSQCVMAQELTTTQIREFISNGECETAQSLYNVYKAMNGPDATLEREIADCRGGGSNVPGGDLTFNVKGVTFTMKRMEGGTFQMGSNGSDAYSNEQPVHSVTVSSFYMGETEVTQALWKAVMDSNPSYFKGDNLPVECVSWNECQGFIRELNRMTGKNFRLPTEAEWEYAARGGNRSNGYKYAGSNTIGNVAWYVDNSNIQTHIVRTKSPNELGLYDMSGNVWEWCQDWYGNYSSGSQTNPQGPSSGSDRVLRGGSRDGLARGCRVSYRCSFDPDACVYPNGFRLALSQ